MGKALASASASHVGLKRELNEDNFLDRPEQALFAVADGMGGLDKGEVASALVVQRIGELQLPAELDTCVDELRDALLAVNGELRQKFAGGRNGTTVVVLVLCQRRFACLWAGDSRLYRLEDGILERASKDHGVVEQLVDAGHVNPDDARHHPMANRITRAVGVEPDLVVDVIEGRLVAGERLILCTDGLHGMIGHDEIARLAGDGSLQDAVDSLVEAAVGTM